MKETSAPSSASGYPQPLPRQQHLHSRPLYPPTGRPGEGSLQPGERTGHGKESVFPAYLGHLGSGIPFGSQEDHGQDRGEAHGKEKHVA